MPSTTFTLEAGLRKMKNSIGKVNALLNGNADDLSCWTILLALKQLESERIAHIRLLGEYRKCHANTHWTVKNVLENIDCWMHNIGVQIARLLEYLIHQLQNHKTTVTLALRLQLNRLCTETRMMLDVEENVLYPMLDIANICTKTISVQSQTGVDHVLTPACHDPGLCRPVALKAQ